MARVSLNAESAYLWYLQYHIDHLKQSSHKFCVDNPILELKKDEQWRRYPESRSSFGTLQQIQMMHLPSKEWWRSLVKDAEMYSEDTTPFGPVSFLATTWRKSTELAGYAQHDAHEFFITSLNHIHSNCKGSTNISCICIIHSTFAGQLQSDVKCERCGNVTSTVDPILDVSLELKEKVVRDDKGHLSLGACLRKYTQPEKLGPKEYTCSKCGKGSSASKRLSFRKLPPVLSFQFKRFEHKGLDKSGSARKLDSPVRLPANLDMMPFTSMNVKDNDKENAGPPVMYQYELFAVINHEGQMDNGHYTNFARLNSGWYRFDDDKVTLSSLGACLKSTPYMCFYVKKHLEYKPHITPTYIRTRETEAVREKALEREKEAARQKELDDALLATV
ncbi:ubiquitin carboxyl-terminal hydrolase 22 [Lentinula edodes]|uniref:Ubiquitin carboxyl-terminal hydrolase 22 n=1 Tax=Lentinula edodes TaxID=5353 RepID=A0A1Q3ECT1_LENED|nr:ubiquitin carboxyl-terminal hydrolase 22 [Lentinula edodes]